MYKQHLEHPSPPRRTLCSTSLPLSLSLSFSLSLSLSLSLTHTHTHTPLHEQAQSVLFLKCCKYSSVISNVSMVYKTFSSSFSKDETPFVYTYFVLSRNAPTTHKSVGRITSTANNQ